MSTSSTTEPTPPAGCLHVGRVGRPHGVRGEMYVDFFTPHPQRIAVGARLWIRGAWHEIASCKPSTDRHLVTLAGIDDRNVVEQLTNADIYGEPIEDSTVVWVHELIGARVVDVSGHERGTCVAVIDNPAHPIMELDSGALVPTPFITSRDAGVVTIDPPEGLFELEND